MKDSSFLIRNGTTEEETWDRQRAFSLEKDVAASFEISTSRHTLSDGTPAFRILNLTDIHYSHDRKNLPKSLTMLRNLIQATKPDLITLTGDQISFYEDKEKYLTELCVFLDSFGIPWAPLLGNHEGFTEEARIDVGNFYLENHFQNVIFRKNDRRLGVGNYVIVFTFQGRIVHSLFMVDSHTDRVYPNGQKDYDFIGQPQFDWYRWACEGIAKESGSPVPSSCFLHIPPVEYLYAWQGYKKGLYEGINANNEPVCCPLHKGKPPYNNGFFEHIRSLGTRLILCGHDHTNTADIVYKDVTLAYSMCSRRNRYCNGRMPAGTTVSLLPDGTFTLQNYVCRHRFRILPVKNLGRFYAFLRKLKK